MISVQSVVEDIVRNDEEASVALGRDYMNLSRYAARIKKTVEQKSKKTVRLPSIIMALSRIQKTLTVTHPLVATVKIDSLTTKLPLCEIVYDKSVAVAKELKLLYENLSSDGSDFLSMTIGTREITIICSEHLVSKTLKKFNEQPKKIERDLAGISLSFDESYYTKPNITFSLIRKFAVEKIPLAETISTYTEIIFVFKQQYLARAIELFYSPV